MSRNWNWIWFLGAGVWFFDAALGMHRGALGRGIADAAVSALFLIVGLLFRRMNKRPAGRNSNR